MLKIDKLSFFNRKLFSYIEENKKLEIIRYNKYLQKNINISIINYLHLANRYIIYEAKGIGKEYNHGNDKLIYEGEFLHTKRNGKGKEYYDDGKLIFEGEYLNDKRNGKGKEYTYLNRGLIFEGEYINGERNGKGKEFNSVNGSIKFEGEYLNGKNVRQFK